MLKKLTAQEEKIAMEQMIKEGFSKEESVKIMLGYRDAADGKGIPAEDVRKKFLAKKMRYV